MIDLSDLMYSDGIHHSDVDNLTTEKIKNAIALLKKGCKIKKVQKTTGLHPKTIQVIKQQISD